jgi:VanZ family protein
MTTTHRFKALSWLAVFVWMLAIYLLSAQPASVSNSNSKGIVSRVVDTTLKVTKVKITEPQKKELVERINNVAREYMHGVVFLVLGFLVQNAVTVSGARRARAFAISLAICVVYAVSDEVHQLFVPGRAFQTSDLMMDTIGSITGILMALVVSRVVSTTPSP